MSRKRKRKKDDHISDSWLLPYSDLLTLLLALFIVLFSMSSIDAQKFASMAQAFNHVFTGGTGFFDYENPVPDDTSGVVDREKDKQKQSDISIEEIERAELGLIQQKVNEYIEESNLSDKLETSLTDEGLLLTISDNVLFDSGSADIVGEHLKTAQEIAELLVMDPPRNIIISGHTDNVPIHNEEFESNWELSAMRAINFMKIVLEGNEDLDPSWFSAKGYGEFKPVASNEDEQGRAKNRRVEILIEPRVSD